MRPRNLLPLLLAAFALAWPEGSFAKDAAAEAEFQRLINAPLVKVLPDGTVGDLDPAKPFEGDAGQPAFEKISIKRIEGTDDWPRWIVSATIVSTNAGGPAEDAGVYVNYGDGMWRFVAMANLKGEVLFETSVWASKSGKPARPAYFYVAQFVSGLQRPMNGAILRQYKFRGE